MIIFSEDKAKKLSIFSKVITSQENNMVFERQVRIPLYQKEVDSFVYFLLYDDSMKVIHEVYEYLNFTIREKPLTTRMKSAFALRMLYCFLSLSQYSIRDFNENVLKELLYFLRGINGNPQQYETKTQRSANTINGYLAVYRSFFVANNIKSNALFHSRAVQMTTQIGNDYTSTTERIKYSNNLDNSKRKDLFTPKYISPTDLQKIYKLAMENKDQVAQALIHLMYGFGLRLGEALGLTTEDISEIYENGKYYPVLYLRNRLSDERYQYAKNLPHVIDKRQYKITDYQRSKNIIIITYELYEELVEYIETVHLAAMKKYPNNYETTTADIVSVKDKPEMNHYVFLNKYGRRLSDQTWNNSLKRYFREANIPLDYNIRENNLSHRFRHGFAMLHARFSEHPVDVLTLQKLMRHRSIASTMVYYNPTPEDEFKIKTDFQEELYKLLPELKLVNK